MKLMAWNGKTRSLKSASYRRLHQVQLELDLGGHDLHTLFQRFTSMDRSTQPIFRRLVHIRGLIILARRTAWTASQVRGNVKDQHLEAIFMLAKTEDQDQKSYDAVVTHLAPLREALLNHSVYDKLDSVKAVCIFMEHHCYPVTDFMCLLKSLQQRLTVLSVPWFPAVNKRRFINEIVVAEETDEARGGGFISHYEMYLEAMREAGADTTKVEHFVEYVRNKQHYRRALQHADVPTAAQTFVQATMQTCLIGKNHEVAASFVFGRENLIPDLFTEIVQKLSKTEPGLEGLLYYLERHIEVDGDEHGPAAIAMMKHLCDGKKRRWSQVQATAEKALKCRIKLWDAIETAILDS